MLNANCRYVKQTIADLFESPAKVHHNYTLILIVSPTGLSSLERIASLAWKQLIPLFYIHSVGFYSQSSLQLPPQFPIVDTHPDPASTQDLRLLDPWLELAHFTRVKTADIENLSDHEHGHIPYLLLLLHYLERWKSTHDGRSPANYKEKTAFRELIRQGIRRDNPEGGEENFDEAVGSVLKSLNPPSISSGLRKIFEVDECVEPESDVSRQTCGTRIRLLMSLVVKLLACRTCYPAVSCRPQDSSSAWSVAGHESAVSRLHSVTEYL